MGRSFMVGRVALGLLLSALFVLVMSASALAAEGYAYYTRGFATNSGGSRLVSYVSAAKGYIYPKPVLTSGDGRYYTVQARTNSGSYVEVGYQWHSLFTSPRCFTGWYDLGSGTYTQDTISASLPLQSWTPFTIEYDEDIGEQKMYVSGQLKYGWNTTGITSFYSAVDAERNTTFPSNVGSWTYVSYRPTQDGGYLYWPYAKYSQRSDPSYYFYDDHVSDSNHWVYVDH